VACTHENNTGANCAARSSRRSDGCRRVTDASPSVRPARHYFCVFEPLCTISCTDFQTWKGHF
jgi:hypothetical protein